MRKLAACSLPPAPCSLLLAGCLGNYQFGARTLFPEGIETVYVPVFDSTSYRRDLGEELTEAVVKEIERRSHYKVVSSPGAADTVLIGTITSETKHLLFRDHDRRSAGMEVNLAVKVSWTDQRGAADPRDSRWCRCPARPSTSAPPTTSCRKWASRSPPRTSGRSSVWPSRSFR